MRNVFYSMIVFILWYFIISQKYLDGFRKEGPFLSLGKEKYTTRDSRSARIRCIFRRGKRENRSAPQPPAGLCFFLNKQAVKWWIDAEKVGCDVEFLFFLKPWRLYFMIFFIFFQVMTSNFARSGSHLRRLL